MIVPLTLSAGLQRLMLERNKKRTYSADIKYAREATMRAAINDFVEILAIGLFVAGIGAVGAAFHAVV